MSEGHNQEMETGLALAELMECLNFHETWAEDFNRSLICGTDFSKEIMSSESHYHCNLGTWLEGHGKKYFSDSEDFQKICQTHQEMHAAARIIAQQKEKNAPISVEHYDHFLAVKRQLVTIIRQTHKTISNRILETDPLTGALTRLTMNEQIQECIDASIKDKVTAVLIMLDIDHFKKVNDTYGHTEGDTVLVKVAECVAENIRTHDLFYRYGGEEFLVCAEGIDLESAYRLCERIRHAISAIEFTPSDHSPFHVTASFGIAPLHPSLSVTSIVKNADRAMYQAKQTGRNRVVIWEPKKADAHF